MFEMINRNILKPPKIQFILTFLFKKPHTHTPIVFNLIVKKYFILTALLYHPLSFKTGPKSMHHLLKKITRSQAQSQAQMCTKPHPNAFTSISKNTQHEFRPRSEV